MFWHCLSGIYVADIKICVSFVPMQIWKDIYLNIQTPELIFVQEGAERLKEKSCLWTFQILALIGVYKHVTMVCEW